MNEPANPPDGEPDVNLDQFVHHTSLPHTKMSHAIDAFLRKVGELSSWLWVVLIAIIVINVISRYVFSQGSIMLEEAQWHIYAIMFLLGLSYTFEADEHIRVDLLHDRMSLRLQAWIELYGIVLLLVPFAAMVVIYAVPFIADALVTNERSQSPGGLPYRWFIKAFLLFGFSLLILAAISRLSRVCALLFGAPRAVRPNEEELSEE